MTPVVQVRGLTKSYMTKQAGQIHAVNGIDLDLHEGEILAFLGSNGAGKTTTIEILEGYRKRTSGQVTVLGADPERAPRSWRDDIGIVLQESEPEHDLTAREALTKYAAYYRDPASPDKVLEIVGLADHANQRNKALSGGQKRRLDLALALIGNPKLIFLDEPATGFDPSARRDALGMIEGLRQVGVSVLLTTHYMDEAEQLADRIVVISGGLIAAQGTAESLADQVRLRTRVSWQIAELAPSALPDRLRDLCRVDADLVSVETVDVTAVVNALTTIAIDTGVRLDSLSVARPNLEDTFLRLTDESSGASGASDTSETTAQ